MTAKGNIHLPEKISTYCTLLATVSGKLAAQLVTCAADDRGPGDGTAPEIKQSGCVNVDATPRLLFNDAVVNEQTTYSAHMYRFKGDMGNTSAPQLLPYTCCSGCRWDIFYFTTGKSCTAYFCLKFSSSIYDESTES